MRLENMHNHTDTVSSCMTRKGPNISSGAVVMVVSKRSEEKER